MAKRCWQERRTDYLWLLLVGSCCLSILPSVTCQYCNTQKYSPQIEISVTRSPANTLPNATSVSLTCKAWQKDDMGMKSSKLRPSEIEWFNPQDTRVKECQTESQAVTFMNCTLMVGVLTKDKVGIYTCRTRNSDNYCWTRTVQVDDFQELTSFPEPTKITDEKKAPSKEKVPHSLNATTESAMHDKYAEAIRENGIKSTTQTYILIGVAVIMLLVVFFVASYWFYRKNNVQSGRMRRSTYSSCEIVPLAEWEILPWQIKYEEELGRGAFGVVYKAILTRQVGIEVFETERILKPEKPCQVVAVKVLKDNPSDEQRKEFSHEIEQMKLLGSHQNIISLVGCCTMYAKKFLVIEYVPFGDLLQWLRRKRTSINCHGTIKGKTKEYCYDDKPRFDGRRKDNKSDQDEVVIEIASDKVPLMMEQTPSQDNSDVILDMTSPSDDDRVQEKRENFPNHENINLLSMPSTPQRNSDDAHVLHLWDKNEEARDSDSFTTQQLFSFAWQIARGMNHLAEKDLIHRDLAARNILVGSDNRVKVSDFGLMREIYEDMNTTGEKSTKLPLKWMAPESIFYQSFSIKSDTWSYGILLWEMATLGGVPYPALTNSELCRLLKTGYRMERPDMCSDEVYELMCECWIEDPSSRPSFSELIDRLEVIMTRDVPYCDLSMLDETSLYYNFPAKLVGNSNPSKN